jgi:hypothetical protein
VVQARVVTGLRSIQFSNSPMHMFAHVHHRPCSLLGAGHACLLLFLCPRRACGTTGRGPRPRRPYAYGQPALPFHGRQHERWPNPTARSRGLNRAEGSRHIACVPHADGFFGLLHAPGLVASADAPRSCELSPGHALGPSARYAGVSLGCSGSKIDPLQFPRPGIVAATASRSALR